MLLYIVVKLTRINTILKQSRKTTAQYVGENIMKNRSVNRALLRILLMWQLSVLVATETDVDAKEPVVEDKAEKENRQTAIQPPVAVNAKIPSAVKSVVNKLFIDGQLPACVRNTPNITRGEFEQLLGELYYSLPLLREIIDNFDNLSEYIKTKPGYEEAAPFFYYDKMPFSVYGNEYSLVLAPRDALSLVEGFVSGGCTALVNWAQQDGPAHLLSPVRKHPHI